MSTSTPKHARDSSVLSKTKSGMIDLSDPRSPTTAFQRTPIQVAINNSNDTDDDTQILNSCKVDSSPISFVSTSSTNDCSNRTEEINAVSSFNCSFVSADNDVSISCVDLSSQDISNIVSDISACSLMPEKVDTTELVLAVGEQIKNVKLENIILQQIEEPSTDSDVTNDSVSETKPLINKPAKKLFYTPSKKRSPLVAVDNICAVTPTSALGSPKNVLREKQWKRIQEERKKLGFESDENFQLPLYDVTASAPSKLMLRRSNIQKQPNFS